MSKKRNLLAVKCGKLIDGTGAEPVHNTTILIENSKFSLIGENITIPKDAKVIDASEKTVLPGLCDGHVHLNSDPYFSNSPLIQDATHVLRATKNARITL